MIQNIIKGNTIDYSVVGIGLNVNQPVFISDAPNPVSLVQLTKHTHSLDVLLGRLLQEIRSQYLVSVSAASLEQLDSFYRNNLFRYHEWHGFSESRNYFKGMITGIGEYGRLQIKLADGNMRQFDFKEVEFVL